MAALMALGLCFAVGLIKRRRLEARNCWLEAYIRDVQRLKSTVELTPMPIARAVERLELPVWRALVANLPMQSAKDAWKDAVKDDADIVEADRETVLRLGDALSLGAIRGQLDSLELHIRDVSILKSKAQAELEGKGKVYTTLGALIGLCVALLII